VRVNIWVSLLAVAAAAAALVLLRRPPAHDAPLDGGDA